MTVSPLPSFQTFQPFIDVEKPQYVSTQYVLDMGPFPLQLNAMRFNTSIPIHFRYQLPGTSTHSPAILYSPYFRMHCEGEHQTVQMTAEMLSVGQVPIGQSSHESVVILVTNLVTTIGAIISLYGVVIMRKYQHTIREKSV